MDGDPDGRARLADCRADRVAVYLHAAVEKALGEKEIKFNLKERRSAL